MRIEVLDKVYECENDISAVEEVFNLVNDLLAESNQNFRCLEVDGLELNQDFDQYIVENIKEIKTIVVKVKTLQELLKDTFISVKEYSDRVIPEIDKLVDEFYQEVSSATWERFEQLLEGLQYVIDTLDVINKHQDEFANNQLPTIRQNLLKRIVMLQDALESQDRVRISDVLLYEIIPSFKSLSWEIDAHTSSGKVH
ncbi:hypothetical protein Desor_4907 [Desulfosporosinus orientis DSM 765]|uniref:Uncharacterized protein n=1 Tax=Desulfosporosinus orientis (strain ATCC 19365 / DSM 765 / NCIMB 8382 / VKM B-1628 / Singapore I) TaxID=768706 RepID=G7WI11_DESOD|nr:hypothetical protein [Desulfosporosinus orientis]AET70308.1 hypothetical protein Desor_4907 [Desulfosporosinus orientis DSM 765]